MICRLPKLCIPSHFRVACCSKTVSTSQDIAAEKDFNSAEAFSVLEATFPPQNKIAWDSQPAPVSKHIFLSGGHSDDRELFPLDEKEHYLLWYQSCRSTFKTSNFISKWSGSRNKALCFLGPTFLFFSFFESYFYLTQCILQRSSYY